MARIAGINIPTAKKLEISLTYIYGIGRKTAIDICKKADISKDVRVHTLTEEEVSKLREIIDRDYDVEGELKKNRELDIKRLKDLGCYRGLRHRKNLPVRGQRTHTNARTRKGKSNKPIAGKK